MATNDQINSSSLANLLPIILYSPTTKIYSNLRSVYRDHACSDGAQEHIY